MNSLTDMCREMKLATQVEVVEDWWETLRARLVEAPLPHYRAVLFFESLTEADKQFKMAANWLIPEKVNETRRSIRWGDHHIEFTYLNHDGDVMFNHAGCQYCDVFVLDKYWSIFEMQYIRSRIRSQCGLQGKLFIEES